MKKLLLILSIFVIVIAIGVLIGIAYYQTFGKGNTQTTTSSATTTTESDLDLTLVPQLLQVPEQFKADVFATSRNLNLPAGFEISVFTAGMTGPRFFDFDDQNNMYVTDNGGGRLVYVIDEDQDGIAEDNITVDENLDTPHGIDYYNGDLYVGEQNQILRYSGLTSDGRFASKEIIISDLPTGGHSTRTVIVGPDEKLYVSIGSSCNVCEETDKRRAAVMRYNLDGSGEEIYSSGLRNSVGIVFAPTGEDETMELWSVDNGRDLLGDDLPPEEVNVLTKEAHFGWPFCYGNGSVNPEFPQQASFCATQTAFPRYTMQAHSAPLGIAFSPRLYDNNTDLPDDLDHNLFIAFHGSWNRSLPTGYKVVTIDTSNEAAEPVDFITGWQDDTSSRPWGRPVGVGFDNNGIMFVSDDQTGAVYRVTYGNN